MSDIDIGDVFKARAARVWQVGLHEDYRSVGFTIPTYQRPYDWSDENIKRLHHDILNGLHRLADSPDTYTFLGTLILLQEGSTGEDIAAASVAVVDGQQRLTTLTLFACALCEALSYQFVTTDFSSTNPDVKDWLKKEVLKRLDGLCTFAVAPQHSMISAVSIPRIVRPDYGDKRSLQSADTVYKSPVGRFLNEFQGYYRKAVRALGTAGPRVSRIQVMRLERRD